MADSTLIQFVSEDADQVLADTKAYYETLLNRQVAPADVEMLLINGLVYREMLLRSGINQTARQNLVDFSSGTALEYLGALVGVSRLPASSALCTIQFQLVDGHNAVTIPQGMRIQSLDGNVIFQTINDQLVPAGTDTVTVDCACSTAGAIGNDYAVNTINVILDPQAFVSTAMNIDVTEGGSDEETDDELRQRIKLAPSSFSVAGPTDAYVFFAKSASPSIVDVAVTSPIPGQVNIYPLLDGGVLPTQDILDAVQAICGADKVRPLTDTVITQAPTTIDYDIEVELTLFTTAITDTVMSQVSTTLNNYITSRQNTLGMDVVVNKIVALCMIDGVVYDVNVVSPTNDIEVDAEVYSNCTGITVTVIGTHDQ